MKKVKKQDEKGAFCN